MDAAAQAQSPPQIEQEAIPPTPTPQIVQADKHSDAATRVTSNKNPKNVAAGKKGAAVRKAKQEAVLEQLRKAKEGLRERAPSLPPAPVAPTVAETSSTSSAPPSSQSTWMPYALIAGAVVLGAAIFTNTRQAGARAATSAYHPDPADRKHRSSLRLEEKSVLETQADPFIMR